MANPTFGNVGDVFKHLVLCELLLAHQPVSHLVSHAGNADYALPAGGRVGDIRHFPSHRARFDDSAYCKAIMDHVIYGRLCGPVLLAARLLCLTRRRCTGTAPSSGMRPCCGTRCWAPTSSWESTARCARRAGRGGLSFA